MRPRIKNKFGVTFIAAAVALHTLPASAQPSADAQKREAKELANKGAQQFKKANFKAAYELFTQADALVPAPTFLLMAARAQERMGALLEARALYDKIAGANLGPSPSAKFKAAQEDAKRELEAIRPRIPSVLIVVNRNLPSLRVHIDSVEMAPARLAEPIQVNPGTRTISASIDGSKRRSVTIMLKEGAREKVGLTFPEDPTPPFTEPTWGLPSSVAISPGSPPASGTGVLPTASASASIPAASPPASSSASGWAIAAFGVGGAGVVMGVVTGVMWIKKDVDVRSQCDGDDCPADLQGEIDTTKLMGKLAVAGFVIGAAGVGAGLYLISKTPGSTASQGGSPQVMIRPGSIAVRGVF